MTRTERFLDLYRRRRLLDQRAYYQRRRDEFEAAQRQANLAAGVLMIGAAMASFAVSANVAPREAWAVLAASLPAIAGVGQAMQRLFAYDRLAKLYDDAAKGLGEVGAAPAVGKRGQGLGSEAEAFVMAVERVLESEQNQWGQLAADLTLSSTLDASRQRD